MSYIHIVKKNENLLEMNGFLKKVAYKVKGKNLHEEKERKESNPGRSFSSLQLNNNRHFTWR